MNALQNKRTESRVSIRHQPLFLYNQKLLNMQKNKNPKKIWPTKKKTVNRNWSKYWILVGKNIKAIKYVQRIKGKYDQNEWANKEFQHRNGNYFFKTYKKESKF